LFERLVADEARVLGPDHRDTVASRLLLAYWTGQAGDTAAARDLFEQLAADQARVLGPDHRSALSSRDLVANWTGEAGDAVAAQELYRRLVADLVRVIGPDDPDTLSARMRWAQWSGQAGDARTARDLYAALAAEFARSHGVDHADTVHAAQQRDVWTVVEAVRTGQMAPVADLSADDLLEAASTAARSHVSDPIEIGRLAEVVAPDSRPVVVASAMLTPDPRPSGWRAGLVSLARPDDRSIRTIAAALEGDAEQAAALPASLAALVVEVRQIDAGGPQC
jgi:hypothetical protein